MTGDTHPAKNSSVGCNQSSISGCRPLIASIVRVFSYPFLSSVASLISHLLLLSIVISAGDWKQPPPISDRRRRSLEYPLHLLTRRVISGQWCFPPHQSRKLSYPYGCKKNRKK